MSALHPTPTRLQLLRDIDAGRLRWYPQGGFTVGYASVNARIGELEKAGWVAIFNVDRRQCVELTDAGRALLEGRS